MEFFRNQANKILVVDQKRFFFSFNIPRIFANILESS